MRIGVSNRHAILSLPTRLQRTPARGPALSTAKVLGPTAGTLVRNVGQVDEKWTTLYTLREAGQAPRKGEQRDAALGAASRIVRWETAATRGLG